MTEKSKATIYVVDDDLGILEPICLFLKKAKYDCHCFSNAEECLEKVRQKSCDLIISDYEMPDMNGVELLANVKSIAPWIPVMVMTGYGEVPLAVKVVKMGAIDFIEKPLDWDCFLAQVHTIVDKHDLNSRLKGKPLTKTEKIILHMILQDKTNKEIAGLLYRSVRTIEVHRSHIMSKLDVDSIVELVKRAYGMELDQED